MAGRKGPALTEGPVTGEARGSGRARPPRDLVLKRAGVPEEHNTHETHNFESQRWRNSLKIRCFGVDLLGIV